MNALIFDISDSICAYGFREDTNKNTIGPMKIAAMSKYPRYIHNFIMIFFLFDIAVLIP